MNLLEKSHIESELHFLQEKLPMVPDSSPLMRESVESRIKILNEMLKSSPDFAAPAQAKITFRGRPVVGTHGVFAEFGLKATQAFTDAITTVAAALIAPLSANGPIPHKDQCQLLITNIATGSFGFEIEENRSGMLPMETETCAAEAFKVTRQILETSVHGTDDELAEYVSTSGSRAISAVRQFALVLSDNDALCCLETAQKSFRFHDLAEVRLCLERLGQDRVKENEIALSGEFQGVLPEGRTFEFRLTTDEEVIRGKIEKGVDHVESINSHLHQRVTISVLETRVGIGRPRYKLLRLPEWPIIT